INTVKKELLIDLHIDFASPVPVYEQLKKIIKFAVAKGTLEAEETLPSIRETASFLKINPNTVARAYRELSQEGVIGGRAGKGFWVAETRQAGEEKMAILKEEFLRFLEKAVAMGFESDVIKAMIDDFFAQGKESRRSND
ncbi:MAG: GntR family transcriptional regulator, partial [bacterium]|nr:GntR family transcriptional regulator [bacterium]